MGDGLFNFPIDEDTKRLLGRLAKAEDRSRAAVIRQLIRREAAARGLSGADVIDQGAANGN